MNKQEIIALIYGFSVITLVSFFSFILVSSSQVGALSGSKWQAGNIISDANFYDNNQMSVSEIDKTIKELVKCDTNGDKNSEWGGGIDYNGDGRITRSEWARSTYNYTGKFVCLADYYENPTTGANNLHTGIRPPGSISAAEIIKRAADQYRINPKVLLVKIRKESPGPLTADEWPLPSQFEAAMGYACPDPPLGQPVVCDPAFRGFNKQISNAAKGLRNYVTNASSYRYKAFQNNTILYNPDRSCGLSTVYIANHATAGLYNYTPYQPNKAALDNLYTEGDKCSAYGNRNFWVMYNQMFGPTISYQAGDKPSSKSGYAKAACTVSRFSSEYVGRLYNPDTRDFLYTTSHIEACNSVKLGFIWDGIVFINTKDDPNRIPIYRLANHERHIYTSSDAVRDDHLNNRGYKDEGIGFYALSSPSPSSTPVYGLQRDETFFITSAGKEAEQYASDRYFNFGTAFYTKKMTGEDIPIYRISNAQHSRLYTASATERRLAIRDLGFKDEGIISTNDLYPTTDNMPIYRLRSPWGTYFYTLSRIERDLAVINHDYFSEGIGFYVYMYSDKPVYRAFDPSSALRIYTNNLLEYRLAEQRHKYVGEGISWYGK